MKRTVIFLCVFVIACSFAGNAKNEKSIKLVKSEEFADSLTQTLTLEEKVSLLSGMGTTRSEFGDKDVPYFGIKGIPEKGIPDFIMGHGITGVRTGRSVSTHSTYFGTPIGFGSTWNLNLYRRVGVAIAKEMRGIGQDLNLGPTINIVRHPLGGRNWECISEDPYITAKFIVPYVKAMQSNGIVCGPKHFVANNQDHNRFDINNVIDERTLREIYLPGFKAAVMQGGAMNIMGSYNRLNGVHMCQNQYLLTDVLRNEWKFDGFVLSDFGQGLRSTLAGVYGGLNLEMSGPKFYGEKLLKEVKDGAVSETKIDEMLFDVIKTMHLFGIFDRERYENKELVHCKEHIRIAKKVAQESPVLLKNENHILPLKKNIKTLAVIGPNAKRFKSLTLDKESYAYYLQGGGSGRSYYFADSIIDPYTGLRNKVSPKTKVTYAVGCQTPDLYGKKAPAKLQDNDDELIREAVRIARKADQVVIFAGKDGHNESEGWDQFSTMLPGKQNELIEQVAKVNKNVIVVVIAGSYVNVSAWVDKVKGLLFVPYCGEQIGNGIADVLLGNIAPSGKLTISWPQKVEDYPEGSILTGPGYTENGISNEYNEGIFVGYRWFDKQNIDVLYPFGYGLSYTQFEYSNQKIDNTSWPIKVTVNIKNTGKMSGAEVAQLYVSDPESKIEKAVKELKGFNKVWLKAGESKTLEFKLNKMDFSHYDVKGKGWKVEEGEFIIRVGSSSRDLKTKGSIEL